MPYPYESIPIPRASRRAFQAHDQQPGQNPGLLFDRYMPDWGREGSAIKTSGLQKVAEASTHIDQEILAAWVDRWLEMAFNAWSEFIVMRTDWRLVPGLGQHGSLEVGFHFNRYGFPYLPGSSLKGLTRAYARAAIAEAIQENENQEITPAAIESAINLENDRDFEDSIILWPKTAQEIASAARNIFGTQKAAGNAIFFDGVPAQSNIKLDVDIMNPHFPEYYQGNGLPTDWQQPIPVCFLTVSPRTAFHFAIGWRKEPLGLEKKLQMQTMNWLKKGLGELGIGAKTSAGYGYFNPVNP